jgi:hypothetical protein
LTYANAGAVNLHVTDTILNLTEKRSLRPRELPPSDILVQRKNELVKLLPNWEDAKSSRIFAQNFFMDYFPEKLRTEAIDIFDKAGKITKIDEIHPDNQLRGTFVMWGEKANVIVSFTLTPENPALIQEYHIRLAHPFHDN